MSLIRSQAKPILPIPHPPHLNPGLTQEDVEVACRNVVRETDQNTALSSSNESPFEDLFPPTHGDSATKSSEWERPKYQLVSGGTIVWASGHLAIFIANDPILDHLRNL
ncbi:hypothetical protein [Pajaroellobacter abortibovis]|uniref:Uncharacterized protein n=1 Tax=Pajaroellobacter abortibovis TaxID=1882918 RepID=A0A1L6MXU9_9BACT|nr:hypothetical protein [Pajaroellobacter abortibovis]APS00364.1 hypothetical protein BCY86_06485 [Pajaroellobacter abortibovis]